MIARASIISESEVSIYRSLFAMVTPLHSSMNQGLFKNMSVIKVATARKTIVLRVPQLSSETEVAIALLCQLCSTCYTAVQMKCLKSTSAKIRTISRYAKEVIMCNHQMSAFHCQQRWMERKGGHWLVPEECIARTVICQKAPLGLK